MKLLLENWRAFLTEGKKVKYYRAQPASTDVIRTNDYITMSRRFAIDHATTSATFHDENFHVVFTLINQDDVKEADNPGEYRYTGRPLKAVPVLMAAPDGDVKPIKVRLEELHYPLADRNEWYGDADYKARGGHMANMTPDEYLRRVRPLDVDEVARENIDDLKNHILSGRTLDPLAIYEDGKEDGRHRAHAAKELGIKQVPVILFENQSK